MPHSRLLLAAAGVLVGLLATGARAGEPDAKSLGFDPQVLAEIDEVVAQGIKECEMPGAVVCIGRADGIAFLKAYGHRQIKPTKEKMTTMTVFDLASLTKPVATATTIMALVQEGKISVDDPVAKYLPEFAQNGKAEITIAQLLTHTSGLIPDNALSDYKDGPEKAWERIMALSPTDEPGTKFKYSDVNYLVLGKLVEKISGMPLNEYAKKKIFEPLGMDETGFLPREDLKKRAAPTEKRDGEWLKGEVHDPRSALLGGVAGHAGLFSTATDLSKYARGILYRTKGFRFPAKGHHVELSWEDGAWRSLWEVAYYPLDMQTAKLMIAPREVPGDNKRTFGWDSLSGFSSNRGKNFSDRAFGHGGFTGTSMWIDPELDLFVIFLSNRLHPDGKGSVNRIAGKIGTIAGRALKAGESPKSAKSKHDRVSPVLTGIDVLKRADFKHLQGRKVGLITNHTGKNRKGVSTVKLLAEAPGVELITLFSPEHGFAGELDRTNIKNARHEGTGLKIYSLYGETREPTAEMLEGIDTLVFDIQDVGARFYTYVSTMAKAMEAAAEHDIWFVVLDRPNPITGTIVAGPVLDEGRESFVGFHNIAVRHGMTIGELAWIYAAERQLRLDFMVIKMKGWRRSDYYDATALPWINPSPNMRNLTQATLYPGIGLLETTNLSVGRGTDTPFEVFGAPWMDGRELAIDLNRQRMPGVRFVPVSFTPDTREFEGELCHGVNVIIVDREIFRPVKTGLAIAVTLRRLYPEDWKTKGYDRLLIDKAVHAAVVEGASLEEIVDLYQEELQAFKERRENFLLY